MQKGDFQKVKIKTGKLKPKADNFTNTTFKSQGIQIKEQLKTSDKSQPTNQRKQTIKDLLCHLNHYNATIRQSSCLGIKDLLTSHPALVTQNLSTLFNNLSVMLTDREDSVRKAGVSVLRQVMQSVSANQISPFFAILNAHICCAMTHINEAIQIDSLAVLDCVLQRYPELVVPHSKDLLTNFVHQISQQKKSVQSTKDMLGAELSVNPSSSMSSQKWRIKVLQRLRQFLQVLVADEQRPLISQSSDDGSTWAECRVNRGNKISHVQMFGQSGKNPSLQEGFVLRSVTQDQLKTSSSSSSNTSYNSTELYEFITSLVPLLIQCWAEVSPRQGVHQGKMTTSAWETLDGVLKVLQLLWRWMEQMEPEYLPRLQKRYMKSFNQQLLAHFPFNMDTSSTGRGKKSTQFTSSVSVVTINLAVCEVLSYFINDDNVEAEMGNKLMSFVMETLGGDGCGLSTEHVQNLLHVTGRLVKVIPVQGMVEELVEGMCILYERCHLHSKNKRIVLDHLAQLTVLQHNVSNRNLLECSAISQWLSSLPSFLLQVKNDGIDSIATALDILLQALSRKNSAAVNTLQDNIASLIDSKTGLLLCLPANLQRKVIELLHHVKQIPLDVLKQLALCCHDNRMHIESVTYLLQILTMSQMNDAPCAAFFSFLFSVNLGCSKSELEIQQQLPDNIPSVQVASVRLSTQSRDLLARHRPLNTTVTMCYTVLDNRQRVWAILQDAMLNVLSTYPVIPYSAMYAILHTSSSLGNPPHHWSEDFTNKLTDCCLAVLTNTVGCHMSGCDESTWEGALWVSAVDVVSQRQELWEGLCHRCYQFAAKVTTSKEADSLEHLESVCTTLTRLIQSSAMRDCIRSSDKGILQTAVNTVLTHPEVASLETRWLAEFKYETALLLTNSR